MGAWEVEGFCALGLTLNVAAFPRRVTQSDQRHADPVAKHYCTFGYNQVPGDCSFKPGSPFWITSVEQCRFRTGSHAVVIFPL